MAPPDHRSDLARRPSRRFRNASIVAGLAAAAALGTLRASDHQDTPEVELNPRLDVNDVYAFPSPTAGRIVLVMTTSSPITPAQTAAAAFDRDVLYQLKVDNTGDGVEDLVLQFTFDAPTTSDGGAAAQQVTMRGPAAPVQTGTSNMLIGDPVTLQGAANTNLGSETGVQLFAGPRDDPFFLDLEQFFRIIPDRKPVSGPLSELPETPTATAFRPEGQAVDYLRGFNALAIVVELPVSSLTAGGTARLGIWGTTSR